MFVARFGALIQFLAIEFDYAARAAAVFCWKRGNMAKNNRTKWAGCERMGRYDVIRC